jgi:bifunctional non-homologous end joining protein LigD
MNYFPLMQPITHDAPLTGDGWAHQVKMDGIRLLAAITPAGVQLYTRHQQRRDVQYPELGPLAAQVQARTCVLDGEVFVPVSGRADFAAVLKRDRAVDAAKVAQRMQQYPVVYYVFDLLMHDGVDLRDQPWQQRVAQLQQIVQPAPWLQCADAVHDGAELLARVQVADGEGIVSKRIDAPYIGGKQHQAWYKIKLQRQQLCVVGGVQLKQGLPNALLLGVYVGEMLTYVGKVAAGLSAADVQLFHTFLPQLMQEMSPFADDVPQKQSVRWLRPQLTVQIAYRERTEEGRLRHAKIHGFTTQPAAAARWER